MLIDLTTARVRRRLRHTGHSDDISPDEDLLLSDLRARGLTDEHNLAHAIVLWRRHRGT